MESDRCQLHAVPSMRELLNKFDLFQQFVRHRLKRMIKRRIGYAANVIRRMRNMKPSLSPAEFQMIFQPGDRVRVKSREEIQAMLDNWNELKHCGFMEEMWPYCDTEQKIFKRVERFLDERDYRVKQTRGVYLLEGLICNGTVDFGPCDRSCFFFWREEWLEKAGEGG